MSGVLLNMSFAGEAGGEIKLTGGTFRVSDSASLPFDGRGGMDTGLSTIGDGDAESALDTFNDGGWESSVEPSVKPAGFGEVKDRCGTRVSSLISMRGLLRVRLDVVERVVTLPVDREYVLE